MTDKNLKIKAERDELLETLERLHRIASVELANTRPGVVEWVQEVIDRIKVLPNRIDVQVMYKVFINGRYVKFQDLQKAKDFCDEVSQKTGIFLGIELA